MSSSKDYMERLRNIRDKYGVSQSKNYPESQTRNYQDHQQILDRNTGVGYIKSELYGIERRKLAGDNTSSNSSALLQGRADYLARPQSSLGLSSQDYNANDYSRKIERERETEKGVTDYSASRRRIQEDLNARNYTRNYSREATRLHTDLTAVPSRSLLGRDYSRTKEDIKNP